MGEVTSAQAVAAVCGGLDRLAEIDVASVSDQGVRDELLALVRVRRQVEAQIAARVAAFDARDLGPADGCRDAKAFLKAFCRQPAHETTPLLAQGRFLRTMPVLASAAARGEVPADLLRQVQELAKDIGAAKAGVLDDYLTTAVRDRHATPGVVKEVCDEVRAWLDPDGPEPDPDKDHEKRGLSLFRRGNHMCVRGLLDLDGGAALAAALDAVMRPPGKGDERSAAQRRADALGDLALAALNRGDLPTVHGERPHLGVLITPAGVVRDADGEPDVAAMGAAFYEWMQQHTGGEQPCTCHHPPPGTDPPDRPSHGGEPPGESRAESPPTMDDADPGSVGSGEAHGEPPHGDQPSGDHTCAQHRRRRPPDSAWLDWVGPIPAELARRIACDADVWRAILDPRTSLPLDVGRAYRVAPHWIRKALYARDRHCRFTGCDAPAQWCDAHHLDHWIDGGRTQLERSLLLCRHHHRLVHEGGWMIEFDTNGEVRISRPGGTPYELGPNPSWTSPIHRRAG